MKNRTLRPSRGNLRAWMTGSLKQGPNNDTPALLYQLITDKNWTDAINEVRSNPNRAREYTRVEISSPSSSAAATPEYANVLPLHRACEFVEAPLALILALLNAYPEACSTKEDTYDRLPVHIACLNGLNADIISLLIDRYWAGLREKAVYGRLPLHYACTKSEALTINILLSEYPDAAQVKDDYGWLPLHVSSVCNNTTMDVMRMMVQVYPDALAMKTIKGRSPIDLLQSYSNKNPQKIEIIKYVTEMMNMIDYESIDTFEEQTIGTDNNNPSKWSSSINFISLPKTTDNSVNNGIPSTSSEPSQIPPINNIQIEQSTEADLKKENVKLSFVTAKSELHLQQENATISAASETQHKVENRASEENTNTSASIIAMFENLQINIFEMQSMIRNDIGSLSERFDCIENNNNQKIGEEQDKMSKILERLELLEQNQKDISNLLRSSRRDDHVKVMSSRFSRVEKTLVTVCEINEKLLEGMDELKQKEQEWARRFSEISKMNSCHAAAQPTSNVNAKNETNKQTPEVQKNSNETKMKTTASGGFLDQVLLQGENDSSSPEEEEASCVGLELSSEVVYNESINLQSYSCEQSKVPSSQLKSHYQRRSSIETPLPMIDEDNSHSSIPDNVIVNTKNSNNNQQVMVQSSTQEQTNKRPSRRLSFTELKIQAEDLRNENNNNNYNNNNNNNNKNNGRKNEFEKSADFSKSDDGISGCSERSFQSHQSSRSKYSNRLVRKNPDSEPMHQIHGSDRNSNGMNENEEERSTRIDGSLGLKSSTSFIIGEGNRHHLKLMEMMKPEPPSSDAGDDNELDKAPSSFLLPTDIDNSERTVESVRESKWKLVKKEIGESQRGGSLFSKYAKSHVNLHLLHASVNETKLEFEHSNKIAFERCLVLSLRPISLLSCLNNCDFLSIGGQHGSTFLDPFGFEDADVIHNFPINNEDNELTPEALSKFCFPNHCVNARLVPRVAIQRAEKLGWIGSSSDKYQIHAFTNGTGHMCYGISVTTIEEMKYSEEQGLIFDALYFLRLQRKAALILVRWWKKYIIKKKLKKSFYEHACLSQINEYGEVDEETLDNSSKKLSKFFRKISHDLPEDVLMDPALQSSMQSSFKGKIMGLFASSQESLPSLKRRQQRRGSMPLYDDLETELPKVRSSGSFRIPHTSYDGDIPKIITNRSKLLAKEAFDEMIKADEIGDVCLVEKCYIVLGILPEEQSLLFCALQQYIDYERKEKSKESSKHRNSFFSNFSASILESKFSKFTGLQHKLCLSSEQSKVSYPENEFEHVYGKQKKYELKNPFDSAEKMRLQLPLPQIPSEFGVALLVLRLKLPSIVQILKLLLIERSVLIIGDNCEEVSACVFALLQLLLPYKWASAFIPTLPSFMFDFVSSPVPFLAGFVTRTKRELKRVENDPRVILAMRNGLSVINLREGRVYITQDFEIESLVTYLKTAVPKNLFFCQSRFEELTSSTTSSVHSFQRFVKEGLTPRESLTLLSIKKQLKKHMLGLSKNVLHTYPDGWKHFGSYSGQGDTKDFVFYPSIYLETLNTQLHFQEIFSHTQLFVEYLEENKSNDTQINFHQRSAIFIAEWTYFKWKMFLKRKSLRTLSSVCSTWSSLRRLK